MIRAGCRHGSDRHDRLVYSRGRVESTTIDDRSANTGTSRKTARCEIAHPIAPGGSRDSNITGVVERYSQRTRQVERGRSAKGDRRDGRAKDIADDRDAAIRDHHHPEGGCGEIATAR
jgi:hypothetical protein